MFKGVDMLAEKTASRITLTEKCLLGIVLALFVMLAVSMAMPTQAHAAKRWIDYIETAKGATFDNSDNLNALEYTVHPSGDKSGRVDHVGLGMVMGKCTTYHQKWNHRGKAVVVNLVPGKTYYISTTLKLYDNVTINANGATVKQVTNGKSVFINALYKDSTDNTGSKKKIGGYKRCSNITINGGTYITTGKRSNDVKWSKGGWAGGYSSFLFMHGNKIKISGVTIKNNYNGHYIEFAGVKNSKIENCTFTGKYVGDSTNEVVQLDTAYNSSVSPQGAPWDGTCCKNITITGCKFNVPKMPVGVGTNYACKKKSSKITVTGNTFKVKKYALAFYKCKGVVAKDNKFKKGKVYIHSTAKSVKLGKAEKKAKKKK